eukprot:1525234-Pleurochrysis_carterae.AAC.1
MQRGAGGPKVYKCGKGAKEAKREGRRRGREASTGSGGELVLKGQSTPAPLYLLACCEQASLQLSAFTDITDDAHASADVCSVLGPLAGRLWNNALQMAHTPL